MSAATGVATSQRVSQSVSSLPASTSRPTGLYIQTLAVKQYIDSLPTAAHRDYAKMFHYFLTAQTNEEPAEPRRIRQVAGKIRLALVNLWCVGPHSSQNSQTICDTTISDTNNSNQHSFTQHFFTNEELQLSEHNKREAIKMYRERTGVSLLPALKTFRRSKHHVG